MTINFNIWYNIFVVKQHYAEVAELADALDSKSSVVPYVPVRVRPSAPVNSRLHAVCVKLIFLVKCILTADYILLMLKTNSENQSSSIYIPNSFDVFFISCRACSDSFIFSSFDMLGYSFHLGPRAILITNSVMSSSVSGHFNCLLVGESGIIQHILYFGFYFFKL